MQRLCVYVCVCVMCTGVQGWPQHQTEPWIPFIPRKSKGREGFTILWFSNPFCQRTFILRATKGN